MLKRTLIILSQLWFIILKKMHLALYHRLLGRSPPDCHLCWKYWLRLDFPSTARWIWDKEVSSVSRVVNNITFCCLLKKDRRCLCNCEWMWYLRFVSFLKKVKLPVKWPCGFCYKGMRHLVIFHVSQLLWHKSDESALFEQSTPAIHWSHQVLTQKSR